MAEGYSISITGLAELEWKLVSLDRRVKRKIVRKAVKAGADIIKHQAEENARSTVGGEMGTLISRRLGTSRFRKQKRGSYGVSLRIRPGPLDFIWITQDGTREYVPSALEFGHVDRAGNFVPAMPYMRPAYDSKAEEATRMIGTILKIGIEITR